MKLIIDIPKSTLIMLKESGVDWLDAEYILSAVAQGIPLDDVKAEIESRSYGVANDSVIQGEMYERHAVLEILNNIGKESKIHCNCTDEEIAKSFIEDVEAVKDLLWAESEDK